jgi:glucose/arabinose dehydrogenase
MVVLIGIMIALLLTLSITAAQDATEEASESEEYTVGVQMVADGLTAPVAMTAANDGSGRTFIVDQTGKIWIMGSDGQMMADPFLDLSGLIVPLQADYDERGVLGLAFHPDYANNGRFFVYYSRPLDADAPAGYDHTNVVAEFNVSADDPNKGDPASAKDVLLLHQPQSNHDSGHIAFGPDGFLYIPIGDGGGANDTDMGHTPNLGNGQDITNLHGSILRIDVNGDPGSYAIPPDNPFADGANGAAPEIFAYGFRNPYHISFDKGGNNDLIVADAGQDVYEEVDLVTLGGNYGWNIKEGTHCFDPNNTENAPASCATTGANGENLVDPVIEYSHDDIGIVVVGGYVYRGTTLTDLQGDYIFGDFSKTGDGGPDGTLLWAEPAASGMWSWGELSVDGMPNNRIGAFVRAFGEDANGELYVMTSMNMGPSGTTGQVWKLVPATGASTETNTQGGAQATTAPDTSGAGATTAPGAAATTAPDTNATPAETQQASG